jgi:membrane protease YdiL (CAAX protease family)
MEETMNFQPQHALAAEAPLAPEAGRWGPWATLLWAFGAASVWVVAQIAGAVMFLLWWHQAFPDKPVLLSDIGNHGPAIAFAVVLATPALLAFLYLATRLARVSFREYLALKWPRWRDVGVALAGLFALILLASFADAGAGKEIPPFVLESFRTARDSGMLPLLILAFAVLAPLQEEIMFRGFLYRGFCHGFGPLPTVLLTAGAWAMLHGQYEWYFVAQIFLLGLYLGWVRWMSGSALLAFFLHALINGAAIGQAAAAIS